MARQIPLWLGPLLTSFLLIVIVVFVCWYYCYWKPKREKRKREKTSKQKSDSKCKSQLGDGGRTNNSNAKHPIGGALNYKYDEESGYGGYTVNPGYCSGLMNMNYGSYCMDYCPISVDTHPSCMVEYSEKPVFNYKYPQKPRNHGKRPAGSRCDKVERACAATQVRKCMKGECTKSPSLPAIIESESMTSLCEEETETKLVQREEGCAFHYSCDESEEIHVKIDSKDETLCEKQDEVSDGSTDSGCDA